MVLMMFSLQSKHELRAGEGTRGAPCSYTSVLIVPIIDSQVVEGLTALAANIPDLAIDGGELLLQLLNLSSVSLHQQEHGIADGVGRSKCHAKG